MKGQTFVNVKPEDPEAGNKWLLFKVTKYSDVRFHLAEVTENIDETFSSSDVLQRFIAVNMKFSFFFGKDELKLIRAPE